MNKIDEIALRVAAEIGAVSYSPPPFRAVRGYSFTYDDLWRFTRALVADPELLAELSKDAEPSLYRWKSGHNFEYQFSEQRENAPEYATKYFTHPAPVIASEQKPEWSYCPECGSEEIHYEEGDHKQCNNCHQEWFSTIDYSNTVKLNLQQLFTSPPNITDIEQRTAEAIAKMIQGWSCTNGPSIAEAIRSGKWREYL